MIMNILDSTSTKSNYAPAAAKEFRRKLENVSKQLENLKTISKQSFQQDRDLNFDCIKIKEKIVSLLEKFPKKQAKEYSSQLIEINQACKELEKELPEPNKKQHKFLKKPDRPSTQPEKEVNELIKDQHESLEKSVQPSTEPEKEVNEPIDNHPKAVLNDTDRLSALKEMFSSFKERPKSFSDNFFFEISQKLKHLYDKINMRNELINEPKNLITRALNLFRFRVDKLLPDIAIAAELKDSLAKDEKRNEAFKNLKNNWVDTLLLYRDVQHRFNTSIIDLTYTPEIRRLTTQLTQNKNYFDNLKSYFEKISVNNLAFQQEDKPDSLITIYKDILSEFAEKYNKNTELTKSMLEFDETVKTLLTQIDDDISVIESRGEEGCSFINEETKQSFKDQKAALIKELEQQKTTIIKKWNALYLNLIKIRHQINLFIKFKHITEKMTSCYTMCKKIIQDLSSLSSNKDDLNNNRSIFYKKLNEYGQLCHLVLSTNKQINSNDIKFLEIKAENSKEDLASSKLLDDEKNYLFEILEPPSFTKEISEDRTLKHEYEEAQNIQKAIVSDANISLGIKDETIGLRDQNAVFDHYNIQKKDLVEELKTYQENIKKAFTIILPEICEKTAQLINQKGLEFTPNNTEPQPQVSNSWSFSWPWANQQNNEKHSFIEVTSPFKQMKLG